MTIARIVLRWLLGAAYLAAGVLHLVNPPPFLRITPGWVPFPSGVVAFTGIAEVLGAIGLVQGFSPALRRAAGWGLAAYALCVWPANFNHLWIDLSHPGHGLPLAYHIPRLCAQPLVIWAALWASTAIDWPFAQRDRTLKA